MAFDEGDYMRERYRKRHAQEERAARWQRWRRRLFPWWLRESLRFGAVVAVMAALWKGWQMLRGGQ